MTTRKRNDYLDDGISDEEVSDQGYDSEAAEENKGGKASAHATKRRKVSPELSEEEDNLPGAENETHNLKDEFEARNEDVEDLENEDAHDPNAQSSPNAQRAPPPTTPKSPATTKATKPKPKHTPGVILLSSLPPYLKPNSLRTMLAARGFTPITRLFLAPADKPPPGSSNTSTTKRSNRRQTYTSGWIEFPRKSMARRCAETLNASTIGGKKGGWYRDDVWNMKYLKGLRWEDLMEEVRSERKEAEAAREAERRRDEKGRRAFVEGVERGKRMEGVGETRRKRKERREESGGGGEEENERNKDKEEAAKWKFTQRGVQTKDGKRKKGPNDEVDAEAKRVLSQIF